MAKHKTTARLWPVALSLALVGCIGPKYQPAAPPPPAPTYKESTTHFKEADGWKVAQPSEAMLRGKWWEIFKDPELNALEEQLNIDNQNIKLFYENFVEACTLIRQARAQYFPTVATSPSYNRSKASGTLVGSAAARGATGVATFTGSQSTLYTLPVDITWAPDLFGRVRKTVREFQYAAQVSAADLENERLIEQATLAQIYFEIRGQDALQKVLNDLVTLNKRLVELAQGAYLPGVGDMISVVQAQNTLETVQAQAINIGIARAQFEHAIATLIGTPASSFSIPVKPMVTEPPPIPIGVPSQLLERRPDIAAAERAMAEANAQIGIAYTAYFPTLTLTAAGGFQSSTLANLFLWNSRIWSIAGTLSETVFDAGLRRATVNQFIAAFNAAVASYRQTVLTAFQQVEDFLASTRILSQETIKLRQAVQSAEAALKLELGRFETGIDPYSDVVIAQNALLSNQETLITTQVSEMVAAVQLITALGGGWDRADLPTPRQVTEKPSKADTKIIH
jgi:NodT family efflux transporter outer membrane factor (OMF) lipoprotein